MILEAKKVIIQIYTTTMNAKCANWNAGKKSWKKGNVAWNMLSACTGMDGLENAPWRRKTLTIHTKSNTAEVLEGRVVGVAATEEQTQIVQHTINISILMDITSPKSLPSLPLKRWKM